MTLDPTLVGGVLMLAVLILVVLLVTRVRDEANRAAFERLAQRLDDAEREQALREHTLQERLAGQERLRRDDHARLIQVLERRLGEAATASASARAQSHTSLAERLESMKHDSAERLANGHMRTTRAMEELRSRFEQRQTEAQKLLNDTLLRGTQAMQRQVSEALTRSSEETSKRLDTLTRNTDERLKAISSEVERRLSDGFEKTTATFGDVLKRLALIDEAQKKITELTGSVVSLQEILADKRSRGAFGEVQLNALVSNVMPASAYALQHTLSNGRRVDCMLFLPEPTGSIAIDSKFPLESFQRMTDLESGKLDRRAAERQFRNDVRNHIKAIAERYILPGETSDGALMFIPAEAVFAEIQAHHPQVVQEAHRARVWMASPTTLVAILNTARAVLKDDATRRQIHVIRRHLAELARDFDRFRERMDRLATHIGQAHRDVAQVHTSARKLSERFDTIEKVEMEGEEAPALPEGSSDGATGSG
jgi:DNA recombination protein RmuC